MGKDFTARLNQTVEAEAYTILKKIGEAMVAECELIAKAKGLKSTSAQERTQGRQHYVKSFEYKITVRSGQPFLKVSNKQGNIANFMESSNAPKSGGVIRAKRAGGVLTFRDSKGAYVSARSVRPSKAERVFLKAVLSVRRKKPSLFRYVDKIFYNDGRRKIVYSGLKSV